MPAKGFKHTKETKRKISEANKNPSKETRKKIGEAQKGKHPSEDTRKKMSEAQKGKQFSEETRKKNSEAQRGEKNHSFGKHPSEETRKKLSESRIGKKNHNFGKPQSEETRRKLSEANLGEKHPQWKGGISFEPYCIKFNNKFKERVRAYFDYKCLECGTPQNGSKLSIHHVNFRKDSCCSEDAPRLFVPLCLSCHAKTNSKRKYWEQYFTEIINAYYGGKCYFTENEMEQRINI